MFKYLTLELLTRKTTGKGCGLINACNNFISVIFTHMNLISLRINKCEKSKAYTYHGTKLAVK